MTERLIAARFGLQGMIILMLMTVHCVQALENNLQIDGTLVSEPCTLDPAGNTVTVDFGTVIMKGLYKDTRTAAVPFVITLTDCDSTLGKNVVLQLNGDESAALPGMLAMTGAGGTGIAIGLETPEGIAVAFNKQTVAYAINDGTTQIPLQAWVQAEPDAIKNKTLVAGEFSAAATLDVSYP